MLVTTEQTIKIILGNKIYSIEVVSSVLLARMYSLKGKGNKISHRSKQKTVEGKYCLPHCQNKKFINFKSANFSPCTGKTWLRTVSMMA